MIKFSLTFFLVILNFLVIPAQEYDIVPYLKQIELGETAPAEELVKAAEKSNKNDPSILFLSAVLTSSGEKALEKYVNIYENFPNCKYADAALFRIFSYYYSLGYYKRAESYLNQMKEFYPKSPYIKMADRNIPDDDLSTGEVTEQTENADEGNYNFTVQAGAFLNIDNARNLMKTISDNGYWCEIETKEIGGSNLNVVLVGRFVNREETTAVIEYLKSTHKINGRIAEITKKP